MSWGAPALTVSTNVIGTINLLEALRKANLTHARVLMAASSAQYGNGISTLPDPRMPVGESTPQIPISPYGVSKASMELLGRQYFANYGMPIVFARLFPQVGLGQSEELAVQSFARQTALAELGRQPPLVRVGSLDTERDYSDVRESAWALARLGFHGAPGEAYNLASGRAHRMRDVLDAIFSQSTVAIEVEVDPQRMRPGDEPLLLGDASKVRELLPQWLPAHNLTDCIGDILRYWRQRTAAEGA